MPLPPPPPPPLPPPHATAKIALSRRASPHDVVPSSSAHLAAELASRAAAMEQRAGAKAASARPPAPVAQPHQVFCDGTEQFLAQMEETQFERYWDAIAPFTFRSTMLPLGFEELEALSAAHTLSSMPMTYSDALPADADHTSRWTRTSVAATAARWPSAVEQALQLVVSKVEAGMVALGKTPGSDKVFVRLSTRSPKDAVLALPGFGTLLAKEVALVEAAETATLAAHPELALPASSARNRHLHAIHAASTAALATETGAEAVARLVLSRRIQEDLRVAAARLRAGAETGGDAAPFNLVVREFGCFDVRNEIRGFVFKGTFTALTQYNQLCYFPSAVAEKAATVAAVTAFMAELIPRIAATSLESFVVDLVLADGAVRVIELNPFAEYAGSGLFAWESSADLAVLTGAAPFEYRVVTHPPSDAAVEGGVAPEFKSLLASMAEGDGRDGGRG